MFKCPYLYLSPVLGWCSGLQRYIVGSRKHPFADCISILARTQHLRPISVPKTICFHNSKFFSIAEM